MALLSDMESYPDQGNKKVNSKVLPNEEDNAYPTTFLDLSLPECGNTSWG